MLVFHELRPRVLGDSSEEAQAWQYHRVQAAAGCLKVVLPVSRCQIIGIASKAMGSAATESAFSAGSLLRRFKQELVLHDLSQLSHDSNARLEPDRGRRRDHTAYSRVPCHIPGKSVGMTGGFAPNFFDKLESPG
jgi:hypothetical protein